ncbi:MAG: hypothetical protein M3Z30_11005 [Gemmatimonadota bacterium]|nr:hypothetical protein [Gemmatimonadota bacterium]
MKVLLTAISLSFTIVISACGGGRDNAQSGNPGDSAARTATTSKPAATAEVIERTADSAQAVGVPAAVADVGTHGEDLYDQVKAADWAKAKLTLDSLAHSVSALRPNERDQLAGVMDTLRESVGARQRQQAIVAANRVTFIGAALTEAYHPKMPANIVRMDYYGREIEIWAAQRDLPKLRRTAADLRKTWDAVRSDEISHGGSAPAARADSLVAQLDSARTVTSYAKLATPILDLVDALEKPFEK